jgi:hypothetical protein
VERKFRIAISVGTVAAAFSWLACALVLAPRTLDSTIIAVAPTGHAYQYIAAPGLNWSAARAAAANLTWQGHHGYLATIDDEAELQFILDRVVSHTFPNVTYLGGRQVSPGAWRWVTGPDSAADGGKGKLFWNGDARGAAPSGRYANWMTTAFQKGGKRDVSKVCCVTIFSYGVPQFSTSLGNGDNAEHVAGYLVEFGE